MNTCIVLVFLVVCECNALELCESDHVSAAFKFINHRECQPLFETYPKNDRVIKVFNDIVPRVLNDREVI